MHYLTYTHFVECVQSLLGSKECGFSLLEVSFTVNLFCCDSHIDLGNLDFLHFCLSLLLRTLLSLHSHNMDQMIRLCIFLCQLNLGKNMHDHFHIIQSDSFHILTTLTPTWPTLGKFG